MGERPLRGDGIRHSAKARAWLRRGKLAHPLAEEVESCDDIQRRYRGYQHDPEPGGPATRCRDTGAKVCEPGYHPTADRQGEKILPQCRASVETSEGEEDKAEPSSAGRCSNEGAGYGVGGSSFDLLASRDRHGLLMFSVYVGTCSPARGTTPPWRLEGRERCG